LSDEFKNFIISSLHKIYPVRHFEFRKIEVKTPLEELVLLQKEKK
jgi:ribosomal protein S3AE